MKSHWVEPRASGLAVQLLLLAICAGILLLAGCAAPAGAAVTPPTKTAVVVAPIATATLAPLTDTWVEPRMWILPGADRGERRIAGEPTAVASSSPSATRTTVPTARPTPTLGSTPTPTRVVATEVPAPQAPRVLAFGDSVILAAAEQLKAAVRGLVVDAAVSRQPAAMIEAMRSRRAELGASEIVVIHIGNNGPLSDAQFDEMLALATGAKRVVFVNLHVPRDWEAGNNSLLARGVKGLPNVVLVDWHSASAGKPNLFWDDGIHLRPEGARAYADLLVPYLLVP